MKAYQKGICLAVATVMVAGCLVGCGGSKSGASSEEKAIQKFITSFLDADIEGMFEASAPNEFWDYLVEDSGLTTEKFFNQLIGDDEAEEFAFEVDEWNEEFEKEGIDAKDVEIEEKSSLDNDFLSGLGHVMKYVGVEGKVEEAYGIELDKFDEGFLYSVDGKWYYSPEWLLNDAWYIVYEDEK